MKPGPLGPLLLARPSTSVGEPPARCKALFCPAQDETYKPPKTYFFFVKIKKVSRREGFKNSEGKKNGIKRYFTYQIWYS